MMEIEYQPVASDINISMHVDNVRIYDWFNTQRMQLFETIASSDGRVRPFLASTTLDFKREIVQQYPVTISTDIEKLGNTSFTLKQQVFQQEQLCATCMAVSVCVDRIEKKSVPIPSALRELLETQINLDHSQL